MGMHTHVDLFNFAAPGANVPFSSALNVFVQPIRSGRLEIIFVPAVSTNFNMQVKDPASGTIFTCRLREGIQLIAGDAYSYAFPASERRQYAWTIETDGVVRVFQVNEVF